MVDELSRGERGRIGSAGGPNNDRLQRPSLWGKRGLARALTWLIQRAGALWGG